MEEYQEEDYGRFHYHHIRYVVYTIKPNNLYSLEIELPTEPCTILLSLLQWTTLRSMLDYFFLIGHCLFKIKLRFARKDFGIISPTIGAAFALSQL